VLSESKPLKDRSNPAAARPIPAWISPDLGVLMGHMVDDPRIGKMVTELSDIERSVPDPALF
jgi:hypothetical protein